MDEFFELILKQKLSRRQQKHENVHSMQIVKCRKCKMQQSIQYLALVPALIFDSFLVELDNPQLEKTSLNAYVSSQVLMAICKLIPLATVVQTKSDSDVIFCLQLQNQTLTCTHHLS